MPDYEYNSSDPKATACLGCGDPLPEHLAERTVLCPKCQAELEGTGFTRTASHDA